MIKIKNILRIVAERFLSRVKFLVTDFDNNTGNVIFLVNGGRSFFKKHLIEAVGDEKIIRGIYPEQACFLGIMFGRWMKEGKIQYDSEKYIGLSRRHHYNCNVSDNIGFDRVGNLIFCDKKTGDMRVESVYSVAASRELISTFDPLVACSIGIHVGNIFRKFLKSEGESAFLGHPDKNNIVSLCKVRSENVRL